MSDFKKQFKDLEIGKKATSVSTRASLYLKETAIPRFSILFEDYGKTVIFIALLLGLIILFVSSFVKINNKTVTQIPTNELVINTNPDLDDDLTYAGFTANYKDLGFKGRVQTSSSLIDKIQIYNEQVQIDIQTTTNKKAEKQTGFNPSVNEKLVQKIPVTEFIGLKDKKLGLSAPEMDDQLMKLNYKLLNISSLVNISDGQYYDYQYNIFAPTNKIDGYSTKAEINISFKNDTPITNEIKSKLLDTAKKIIGTIDRVDKKEIFIDSSNKIDTEKIFSENKNKFVQSELLKYRIYIPDGYKLINDTSINKISITNNKSTLEITRRDNQTEAFNTRISNIIQVSTSKALRPASISDVEENIFKLPLYGNDGKDRTVNVSKDSNAKNHNLLINYIFNFDQSVDNLRKTINDFDLVVASITDNPSPSGNCELLKGQAIPFKSPFCGRELEWTKINQEFKSDHKAIDIVPNSEYAKSNPQYLRDKKEYFYATCDGKIRNYQDKETKANVIELQCKEQDFKVQYWHDQESFWKFSGEVKAGEILGVMGESGNSENGKHLHYIIEKAGVRQDPLQLINNS